MYRGKIRKYKEIKENASTQTQLLMAEDIYTAAGWVSMYQNGYLHGSPLGF